MKAVTDFVLFQSIKSHVQWWKKYSDVLSNSAYNGARQYYCIWCLQIDVAAVFMCML